MNGAQHDRVRELFVEACDLDAAARRALLDRACAGDPALRREVEELLGHDGDEHELFSEEDVSGGILFHTAVELETDVLPEALAAAAIPGRRLGNYTLVRRLGAGGMGVVFEAEQDDPRRRVALKLLGTGTASRVLLQRFRREARALGRLEHPGIARIYEAGRFDTEDGERPFFAMQLVDGVPLTTFARERSLDTEARLELVAKVCDAVEHAHERGVVHRDLKPANVLVTADGQPVVLDFGVARVTGSDTVVTTLHTTHGQLVGTLPYMSPEQVGGDTTALDERTDVYALGVMLYELLAGRLPIDIVQRSIPDAARRIQEHEPTRLGVLDARFRGAIETIAERALEKDPARRYHRASDLGTDLRRHLAQRPILAQPVTAFTQLRRFARRHKAIVIGTSVAFLALLVALGISLWRTGQAFEARDGARAEAVRSALLGASAALEGAQPILARELLEGVPEDRRDWEWRHLDARLDPSLAVLAFEEPLQDMVVRPGGEELLVVTASGRLSRHALPGGEEVAALDLVPEGTGPVELLARLSRDGRRVVVTEADLADADGPSRVRLHDTADGRLLAAREARGSITRLAIGPSGAHVVWFDPKQGSEIWTPGAGPAERLDGIRKPIFALSEDLLVRATGAGVLQIQALDAEAGGAWKGRSKLSMSRRDVCLASDASWIGFAAMSSRIAINDTASGKLRTMLHGHTGHVLTLCAGADGNTLVSAAEDGTIRVWDVARETTRAVLTGHRGTVKGLSATGDVVAARLDHEVRIWTLVPPDVLRDHGHFVYPARFSPDGSLLATGDWGGYVVVGPAHGAPRTTDAAGAPETAGAGDGAGAAATAKGPVSVGDADTTLKVVQGQVMDLDWDPEGRRIVVGGGSGRIVVIDVAAGTFQRHDVGRARKAAVAWVGEHLVATGSALGITKYGQPEIRLVDTQTGEFVRKLEGHEQGVRDLAVHRGAGLLASVSKDTTARLWRLGTWEPVAVLEGHTEELTSAAFSPDGRLLATGSVDATVRIWDVASGETLQVLGRHTAPVYGVAFSPDGTRLATAGEDQAVRLFDVDTGAYLLKLGEHDDYVWSVAFDPDGSRLVSASGDGTVRVWDTRRLRSR